jgi:hypothetical protein
MPVTYEHYMNRPPTQFECTGTNTKDYEMDSLQLASFHNRVGGAGSIGWSGRVCPWL